MIDRIERHSTALKILAAISAAVAALILVFMNGGSGTVSRPFVAFIVLPWAVFFAAWLPLIYLSWFRDAKPSMTTAGLKIFYYCLLLACIFIFGGIYGGLLFS